LVSPNGYPLTYDIFKGNKFEGETMMPIINGFKEKHQLNQLVIVADSGLLSQNNIDQLISEQHQFILGARIKNETKEIKQKILALNLANGQHGVIEKGNLRLIITHSDTRSKKDLHNRFKGLKRLEKQISNGKLTKSQINKRGYNKYLKLDGAIRVAIDQEKFDQDAKWDGLKGYLTNASLSNDEVLANYQHLWQIEKAFRVAKTDLKIRPVFHRLQKRIEAHICMTFVAYKVYKELERLLKDKSSKMSPEKAIEIAKSIFQIQMITPSSKSTITKTIIVNQEQQELAQLFEF
jgi:transposase